jgi:L-ascorbate metabolism protein UlaG (beta-lactamase superfamily)
MKISWLGHSSFRLEESTSTAVVTDPYPDIGITMPKVKADAITISESRYSNTGSVLGNPVIFNKPGIYDFKGVGITAISPNDDGEKLIFKFRMDGIEICHLGGINQSVTSELIDILLPVNVLLIPIGGNITIGADKAKEYVDALMPDIVIPMHYRVKNLSLDIDKPDGFVRLFDPEAVECLEQNALEVSREDLDAMSTKVVIFK